VSASVAHERMFLQIHGRQLEHLILVQNLKREKYGVKIVLERYYYQTFWLDGRLLLNQKNASP